VSSSPLVVKNDPTLLFANAGMNQFKNIFLGLEKPEFTSAVTAQKCLRAGGKHNDIEEVGHTPRHHTYFEMLGNFSFGRYFKEEAIVYAWDFITKELQLPKDKLRVSVFETDSVSSELWHKVAGIPPSQQMHLGEADNFWSMGPTGPCGPCTEIFYDLGDDVPANDRLLEIWNLVFMTSNRLGSGELEPLQRPCVDTGMGLERIASVVQGVSSNYETDAFVPLLAAAGEYFPTLSPPQRNMLVDHVRSVALLLAEGVLPSAEGAGYVLRKLIRRASAAVAVADWKTQRTEKGVHHSPMRTSALSPLIPAVVATLPQLEEHASILHNLIEAEESSFLRIVEGTLPELLHSLDQHRPITVATAWQLSTSRGLPLDIIASLMRSYGQELDMSAVETLREEHALISSSGRLSSSHGSVGAADANANAHASSEHPNHPEHEGEKMLFRRDVMELSTRALGAISPRQLVLPESVLYPGGGGQAPDGGTLTLQLPLPGSRGPTWSTTAIGGTHALTLAESIPPLFLSQLDVCTVYLEVDLSQRQRTSAHHSATHLLHAALRHILGPSAVQAGSEVTANRLRFDFLWSAALSPQQLEAIEQHVNAMALANAPVLVEEMSSLEEVKATGALSLFSEALPVGSIRVVRMDVSLETCMGTHVPSLEACWPFVLLSESSSAAGVRRIEAVAGKSAVAHLQEGHLRLQEAAGALQCSDDQVLISLQQLKQRLQDVRSEKQQLTQCLAQQEVKATRLQPLMEENDGTYHLLHLSPALATVSGASRKELLQLILQLVKKDYPQVVLVCGRDIVVQNSHKSLVPSAKDLLARVLRAQGGGKGGGSLTYAAGQLAESDWNPTLFPLTLMQKTAK
jgi:alanyl-tRNA synthetase